MNKKIKNLIALCFLLALSLSPLTAIAQEADFEVDFGNLPFQVENWYPGQTTSTKTITLTNNLGFEEDFYLGAELNSESDKLAEVLTVHVEQNQKNLKDLFNDPVSLGVLDDGESKEFTLSVSFNRTADNNYQNKEISFSFLVGLKENKQTENETDQNETTSSVSGQRVLAFSSASEEPFQIFALFDYLNQDRSVISWVTNKPATSRVIYGTRKNAFNINSGSPSYGYQFYTEETENKSLYHSVTLTDLEPGVVYYYRAVSYGSLAISSERKLTIPEKELSKESSNPEVIDNEELADGQEAIDEDDSKEEETEEIETEENEVGGSTPTSEQTPLRGLAATIGDLDLGTTEIVLLLILILIVIAIIISDKLKERSKNS